MFLFATIGFIVIQVDRQRITPSVVTPDTRTIRVRFHVSACSGRSVEGALVYATPTPYQQFTATEQPTAADGFAVLTMRRLRFFPASKQQQLLVVFARARKPGEDLLGGVSEAVPIESMRYLGVGYEQARTGLQTAFAEALLRSAEAFAELRATPAEVIAEQIPAKLIPDVIKNTAVKIVHLTLRWG